MRIPDIEQHLRENLPVAYPSFSGDFKAGTSASVSSNVMTVVSAQDLPAINDDVIITGLTYQNTINSVTMNLSATSQSAIIDVAEVHEFTEGFNTEVTITGATEPEWNDTFNIISVPSRYQIEIECSNAITGEPTGSPLVNELDLPRYNSRFTVTAVNSVDFEVSTVNAPDGSLIGTPSYINVNDVCVSSDVDLARIFDAYTVQPIDKLWLFVIAGATTSSRDRSNDTDFERTFQEGDSRIIHTQENISIFAIFPAQDKVSAVQGQDIARNDLRNAILSLLVGYIPDSSLTSKMNMMYYIADGIETYNSSYYIHRYDFACNVNITNCDTYIADSYAVRKINSDYINEDTGRIIAQDQIDYTKL